MSDAIEPTGRTLKQLSAEIDRRRAEGEGHWKGWIASVWHLGSALNESRPKVPHGQWYQWLSEHDLNERTASRAMRFAAGFTLEAAMQHATITSALDTLKAPKALPADTGKSDTVSDLDSRSTDELTADFRQHRAEFKELAPELVAQWWHLGGVLIQIKSELSADDFAVWCDEGGITPTESSRMIDLNNRYSEGVVANLDHESIVLTWIVEGVESREG